MRLGLGINNTRKLDGEYAFINATASTYFSSLTVAGFTHGQSVFLYGLSFDQIKEAVDIYFIALDDAGLLSAYVAMYPMIGGTAATHAINALNPGTFDISWFGSPTHSATGTDFNGTNQWGDTGVQVDTDLTTNDVSLHYYTGDNVGPTIQVAMGARGVSASLQFIIFIEHSTQGLRVDCYDNVDAQGSIRTTNTDGPGFYGYSRRSSTEAEIYKNGTSLATDTTGGGTPPPKTIFIGARNNNDTADLFSTYDVREADVGSKQTDTEHSDSRDAVQTLQTTLSRAA